MVSLSSRPKTHTGHATCFLTKLHALTLLVHPLTRLQHWDWVTEPQARHSWESVLWLKYCFVRSSPSCYGCDNRKSPGLIWFHFQFMIFNILKSIRFWDGIMSFSWPINCSFSASVISTRQYLTGHVLNNKYTMCTEMRAYYWMIQCSITYYYTHSCYW